jgi:hypothetical protein
MPSFNLVSPDQAQFLRLEESLVDCVSKIDLQLESLSTTQEELLIVKDYLERTELPSALYHTYTLWNDFLGNNAKNF